MRSNMALGCCTVLSEESRANMQEALRAKAGVGLGGGGSTLEYNKM